MSDLKVSPDVEVEGRADMKSQNHVSRTDRPAVTVCVTAYNQEKYIGEALDSILAQRTDFEFIILIHDDASTDRTARIIKEYESAHPERIHAIYQTVNQYSQNIGIQGEILSPLVTTEFTALNEGDDFWIDPNKLQIQYDYMIEHPECAVCCHAARQVLSEGQATDIVMPDNVRPLNTSILDMDTILAIGGALPTNSFFYRQRHAQNGFPEFYNRCAVGDYPMILYLATQGSVYFLNRHLSAYRFNAEGSWTRSWVQDPNIYIRTNESIIRMLDEFDEFTGRRHQEAIRDKQINYRFENIMLSRDLKAIADEPYRSLYRALSFKRRLRFQIASRFKALHRLKRSRDLKRL